MASTPPTNEAFLREVDEAVRQDQFVGFWKRWGKILIGAIVAGVLALGGYLWWQNEREAQAGRDGETLNAVLDDLSDNRTAGADAKLQSLSEASSPGYRATARLTRADLLLAKGDAKGAAAAFGAIADDTGIDAAFRDLARVRQTAAEFDTLPPATVVARMQPMVTPGAAFHGSAGEMLAAAFLKQGKQVDAARVLNAVAADQTVPASLRERAGQLAVSVAAARAAPASATPATPAKGN